MTFPCVSSSSGRGFGQLVAEEHVGVEAVGLHSAGARLRVHIRAVEDLAIDLRDLCHIGVTLLDLFQDTRLGAVEVPGADRAFADERSKDEKRENNDKRIENEKTFLTCVSCVHFSSLFARVSGFCTADTCVRDLYSHVPFSKTNKG